VEALGLLLFVGAVWVLGAVALFAWNVASRGHEHTERLAILPLEDNWQDPQMNERLARASHDSRKVETTCKRPA
jgi:hypothetical protein